MSRENSFCACDVGDGGLCHPLLQRDDIQPVMAIGGSEAPFDANEPLEFEMTVRVAQKVFPDGRILAHVRIVEGNLGA